jgi:formylglycine-generating enzyme required for sulfatase activity
LLFSVFKTILPDMSVELFISYKREPASTKLAKELVVFIEKYFPWVKVMLDDTVIQTGASIKAYMDRLTQGNHIIFLLSPEFLESHWCMYELALTSEYSDFKERIIHLRFPGVQIGTVAEVAKVTKAWQKRYVELKMELEEIASIDPDQLAPEFEEELRIAKEIVKGCGKALLHMRGTIGVNVDEHGGVSWEEMGAFLKRWIGSRPKPVKTLKDSPLEEAILPSDTARFHVQNIINDMVLIEGGTFEMGSEGKDAGADASPVHLVYVPSFKICRYQVTQIQWRAVMGNNPSYFGERDNYPVEMVSWNDCRIFIDRLGELTGMAFRLPTEAEWEYAAQGGIQKSAGKFEYVGGNDVDEIAWYRGNSGHQTHPVGAKPSNQLGLFDMAGNVFEWCEDWYDEEFYAQSKDGVTSNPICEKEGIYRVVRGGAWDHSEIYCRPQRRYVTRPKSTISNVGFRLALDV